MCKQIKHDNKTIGTRNFEKVTLTLAYLAANGIVALIVLAVDDGGSWLIPDEKMDKNFDSHGNLHGAITEVLQPFCGCATPPGGRLQ